MKGVLQYSLHIGRLLAVRDRKVYFEFWKIGRWEKRIEEKERGVRGGLARVGILLTLQQTYRGDMEAV